MTCKFYQNNDHNYRNNKTGYRLPWILNKQIFLEPQVKFEFLDGRLNRFNQYERNVNLKQIKLISGAYHAIGLYQNIDTAKYPPNFKHSGVSDILINSWN
uniref:Uncharacterized protein n=1 Tax=Homalodisca liturata TaxID=320908 RepID=A0A1B6JNP5_9HEMI